VEQADTWLIGSGTIDIRRGILVGVLNVTPDSFSDGGDYVDVDAAVTAGLRMAAEGATLVDVGGESTRPGSEPVPVDAELARVLPVVRGLVGAGTAVSIDTRKAAVATAALEAGAVVVNDVKGFRDPAMIEAVAGSGAGVVVMHMLGEPRTMQDNPRYDDVVAEVRDFLVDRARALEEAGVTAESIAIDPGFGFGKTVAQNLELISRLREYVGLGYPVMLGTSRKSTLGQLTGEGDPKGRDGHTAVTTALGYERGARLFRVHNVAESRGALRIAAAIVDPDIWEEWQQD
jgi:dihydropteroate synthase